MGSGTSKEKSQTVTVSTKPVTVANVNNNTTEQVRSVESKSVNHGVVETTRDSPAKSPVKDSKVVSSNKVQSPTKSVKNANKLTGKVEWNDSDDDDDWDDFLGKNTKSFVSNTTSKVVSTEQVRDSNSYNNNNNPPSEEHYPETYAQRHTRQLYTFGQDRLIREKTIYRNPDEWGLDDEEEETTKTGGFDASKFRQVNQGQSARDKEIFTPREDDIEMPKFTDSRETEDRQPQPTSTGPRSQKLPQYTQEEEDLMDELMGGNSDYFVPHQAVNTPNVMSF